MNTVTVDAPVTPAEATDEEVRAAALAWAQEFKSCAELPRGTQDRAFTCPLARATGRSITSTYSRDWRSSDSKKLKHPPMVAEFVARFDAGRFPDLKAGE